MARIISLRLFQQAGRVARPWLVAMGLLPAAWCAAYAQTPPPCLTNFTSPLFVPVLGRLTDVFIDDQCQRVYLTNASNNTVEVFSLANGSLQAPIQVGSVPTGLDTSPDGKTLYVANSGANNLSVVDLATGVETMKVPVAPSGFINDTPFSLAVAKSGLVLFSTTFAGSGFGARMLQYDPASNTVSLRSDFYFFGSTTEITSLRASGDRSVIGVVAGDISSGPVFEYSADANVFGTEKDLNAFVSFIALDGTGSTALVNPGTYVLGSVFNLTGTIPGGNYGVAVDPGGAVGYQVGTARIDVLDLKAFTKTNSLAVGDTLNSAQVFFQLGVGKLAISRDGAVLAVITDNGFSLVQTNIIRYVSFASMSARAQMRLHPGTGHDRFDVEGAFTLGSGSNGISPPADNAAFEIGSVTLAIPAGSFEQHGNRFEFEGTIDGIALKVSLHPLGNDRYRFFARGENATLSGSSLPLTVGWAIGSDRGTATLDRGEVEVRNVREREE